MSLPQVAIVGRPNVGKSSLFNRLVGRRISIVDPTPGVTRDRISAPLQVGERHFELVDTGGMGIEDVDRLTDLVEGQIQAALDQASVLVFVVDGRAGLAPLDEDVVARLRKTDKPVLLVVNKCDNAYLDPDAADFHRLGIGSPMPVSAKQGRNKAELLAKIAELLPAETPAEPAEPVLKLAIVGRRNTGKSTFINAVARAERVIVSEVPGTTRDSIDVRFELHGKTFLAIDTAGLRRKSSVQSDIEFYSLARAERSIRRADVVLLLFDANHKVSMVDKQLAGYILEHFKPAIFVVNKWDLLAKDLATGDFGDYLRKVYPSLDFVPIAFTTAKKGRNVQAVLDLAQKLHKQASARVTTGDLNRVLRFALEQQSPPLRQNRRPIFFATQVAANPPTIVLFTNGPQLFDPPYQRYLLKTFRDHLPFQDVPIKMYLRHRHGDDKTGEVVAEEDGQQKPKKPARPRKVAGKSRSKKGGAALWKDV